MYQLIVGGFLTAQVAASLLPSSALPAYNQLVHTVKEMEGDSVYQLIVGGFLFFGQTTFEEHFILWATPERCLHGPQSPIFWKHYFVKNKKVTQFYLVKQ
jgi:hypothetical protein